MKKAIYISIKPEFTKRIETGEKNYEFRKYIPKKEIDTLFVYESSPTCQLKYIIELGDIIEYPNKIKKEGYGNEDFNNGLKSSKYAYEIKKVFVLKTPITLDKLRKEYSFVPPQSYAYATKYQKLTDELLNAELERLV